MRTVSLLVLLLAAGPLASPGADRLSSPASGPASTPGFPVVREWYRAVFGSAIGRAGLRIVDLDGDGDQEIVATASLGGFYANRYWYIVSHSAGRYEQVWASAPYPVFPDLTGITDLQTAQVDDDPALEVVVAVSGEVLIYDGATRALQRTMTTAAEDIRGLTVADVDGDGALEVVFCSDTTAYVYDLATGTQEYAGTGRGGMDLAVGNVDDDPGLEIVVGNGTSTGYVLDGATRAVEWANAWGFGDFVRLGDVDGDGRQEVVSGYRWDDIRIFDADLQSLAGDIAVDYELNALQVVDVEGDGPLEIVYGESGRIYVHNGQTRALKGSVGEPEAVNELAVGDPDGDGVRELVWGSRSPSYLNVVSTASQLLEWRSVAVNGPFYGLAYGDVDADGRREILSTSYGSKDGYGGGWYFVHDARTKAVEYESGEIPPQNWPGLWRIASANVDDDPQQEIFVTPSEVYTGVLSAYDGLSHTEQWRVTAPSGLTFRSLALADVDGDGQVEVVAGVHPEHTGAPGSTSIFTMRRPARWSGIARASPVTLRSPCFG